MVVIQKRAQRKPSGARYKNAWSKRLHHKGGNAALTGIGETKVTTQKVKGGDHKNSILRTNVINVYDSKAKKNVKASVKAVLENPANRHFVRRNIMTKGTVVDTSIGKVRITNRPGQEGTLNGSLVE